MLFQDNSLSTGNTPLVKINRLNNGKAIIYAKLESRNPAFSVKCRVGTALIADAEKRGLLKPGTEIIEPTSGNTGIALAYVAAARGYKLTLTMPETMTVERRKLLKFLGAELVLTPGPLGMSGAVKKAEEIKASAPKKYFMPGQFDNPANPAIHEATTGPEIWKDTNGTVDALIAGVGTGGTITGISRFIKKTMGKAILSVAVEPEESPVISQTLAGQKPAPSPHGIQGIGAGFVPANLDLSLVDFVEKVNTPLAIQTAKDLALNEGILSGISGGAAIAAALRLAQKPEFAGKNIVAIVPDSAERYISGILFNGI